MTAQIRTHAATALVALRLSLYPKGIGMSALSMLRYGPGGRAATLANPRPGSWRPGAEVSFLGEAEGSVLERVLTGGGRVQPQASFSASQSLQHPVVRPPAHVPQPCCMLSGGGCTRPTRPLPRPKPCHPRGSQAT